MNFKILSLVVALLAPIPVLAQSPADTPEKRLATVLEIVGLLESDVDPAQKIRRAGNLVYECGILFIKIGDARGNRDYRAKQFAEHRVIERLFAIGSDRKQDANVRRHAVQAIGEAAPAVSRGLGAQLFALAREIEHEADLGLLFDQILITLGKIKNEAATTLLLEALKSEATPIQRKKIAVEALVEIIPSLPLRTWQETARKDLIDHLASNVTQVANRSMPKVTPYIEDGAMKARYLEQLLGDLESQYAILEQTYLTDPKSLEALPREAVQGIQQVRDRMAALRALASQPWVDRPSVVRVLSQYFLKVKRVYENASDALKKESMFIILLTEGIDTLGFYVDPALGPELLELYRSTPADGIYVRAVTGRTLVKFANLKPTFTALAFEAMKPGIRAMQASSEKNDSYRPREIKNFGEILTLLRSPEAEAALSELVLPLVSLDDDSPNASRRREAALVLTAYGPLSPEWNNTVRSAFERGLQDERKSIDAAIALIMGLHRFGSPQGFEILRRSLEKPRDEKVAQELLALMPGIARTVEIQTEERALLWKNALNSKIAEAVRAFALLKLDAVESQGTPETLKEFVTLAHLMIDVIQHPATAGTDSFVGHEMAAGLAEISQRLSRTQSLLLESASSDLIARLRGIQPWISRYAR